MFALLIQTLPHELLGFGHSGIVVDMLALFPSDLVALTSGARGALHDSLSWPLYNGLATLLMWSMSRPLLKRSTVRMAGGRGAGSTHKTFLASHASFSIPSSSVSASAYFRYHQHQPSLTSVWLTLVPSSRNAFPRVRPYLSWPLV